MDQVASRRPGYRGTWGGIFRAGEDKTNKNTATDYSEDRGVFVLAEGM